MRRYLKITLMVILVLLVAATAVYAQDTDPDTVLERAEEAVSRAEALNDFAFNLLGIFEAVSVAITIVGAALGAFGFARIISAQDSLDAARKEVRAEMAEIRDNLNTELSALQQEFERRSEGLAALSTRMESTIEEQRKVITDATLATVLLSFGERQFKASDYTGAIDAYNRALKLDSRNPVTYYRLGYVYTTRGDLDQAESHLLKSLEMDEEFTSAKIALGLVYRRKGEQIEEGIERERLFNEAERWMIEGLQTSPRLIDEEGESWWGALGGLYRRRNQIDQAIYAYEQATTVTPDSSYPFGNLARLYGQEKEIDKMLDMYRRVARLAAGEVQRQAGNYWGYFDLFTAKLVINDIENIDNLLLTVKETVPSDAAYAFGTLVGTLRSVADTLDDSYPQKKIMLDYANRIEDYMKDRERHPAPVKLESRPEDTVTMEALDSTE